jgi:hypothetical protein
MKEQKAVEALLGAAESISKSEVFRGQSHKPSLHLFTSYLVVALTSAASICMCV